MTDHDGLIWQFIDTYLDLNAAEEKTMAQELSKMGVEKEAMEVMGSWERRGWTRGRTEGRIETLQETILRLVRRRFGSAGDDLRGRLQRLSITQLEQLTEDLLDFTASADIATWLEQHTTDTLAH